MNSLARIGLTAFLFGALGMQLRAAETAELDLRVARIAVVEGPVMMQRRSDDQWVEATVNAPLLAGDKLYTGNAGRAEIQLEDEVVVRLGADSYVDLVQMDSGTTELMIPTGDVIVQAQPVSYVRPFVTVRSAQFSVLIDEFARVRLQVGETGHGNVQVRRGSARVQDATGRIVRLAQNQGVGMSGAAEALQPYRLGFEDNLDYWSDLRDAVNASAGSRRYVSTRVSGYQELDRHGEWVTVEEYGRVWRPYTADDGWAPYRYGRWIWRDGCDWVWVADEPWGWVPYHYGRWVNTSRHRWCWVPGHVAVVHHRPLWSPALVAFTYSDHSSNWSFSLGVGVHSGPFVGWFALGPRDPYCHPWYAHRGRHDFYSHGYQYRHLDGCYARRHDGRPNVVINQTIVNNHIYQNQYVTHAVNTVSKEQFGGYKTPHAATLDRGIPQGVKIGRTALEGIPSVQPRSSVAAAHTPSVAPRSPSENLKAARTESRNFVSSVAAKSPIAADRSASAYSATESTRNKVSSYAPTDHNEGIVVPSIPSKHAITSSIPVPRTSEAHDRAPIPGSLTKTARTAASVPSASRDTISAMPRTAEPKLPFSKETQTRSSTPSYTAPSYKAPSYKVPSSMTHAPISNTVPGKSTGGRVYESTPSYTPPYGTSQGAASKSSPYREGSSSKTPNYTSPSGGSTKSTTPVPRSLESSGAKDTSGSYRSGSSKSGSKR